MSAAGVGVDVEMKAASEESKHTNGIVDATDKDKSVDSNDSTDAVADLFVKFPLPSFADASHSDKVRKPFRLPLAWSEAKKTRNQPAATTTTKTNNTNNTTETSGDANAKKVKKDDDKSSSSSAETLALRRAADRAAKEKEKLAEKARYDKLIPEVGVTPRESFDKLVNEIFLEGRPEPTNESARQEMAAQRAWEIPYMAHFLWLFHSSLNLRPLEPQRLEQILLQPTHLTNEATFSEVASKLLFATRLHYTPHFKKSLAYMGRNQRCFQYELICDWMCFLLSIWIEQSKQRKFDEAGDEDDSENDVEGGGDEEDGGNSSRKRTHGGSSSNKKGRNKSSKETNQSDSDISDDDDDEEERDAYNVHLVSDGKWRVDMEELFNNINPFVGTTSESQEDTTIVSATATSVPSSTDMTDVTAVAAASSSSSPTPPSSLSGPTVPIRRKLFHELSLTHRITIMKLLFDFQLYSNPFVASQLKEHKLNNDPLKELHLEPFGTDSSGRSYFFFGYSDCRIYVQGQVEWNRIPKSIEELAVEEFAKAEWKRQIEQQVKIIQDENTAAAAAVAADKKKKTKSKSMHIDEDAPLSILLVHSPPTNVEPSPSSNNVVIESNNGTPPVHSNGLTSNTTTSIVDAASSLASTSATAAAAASSHSPGLPFTLLPAVDGPPKPRELYFTFPTPPPFALLTHSSKQIRSLLERLGQVEHPRNDELIRKLKQLLEDLEMGRGRKVDLIEEEDTKSGSHKKGKKDITPTPKRISDRLMSLEAAREEAERIRILRAEEESRARYTRRHRWIDEMSLRNLVKVRKAYEKFMNIETQRQQKDGSASTSSSDDDDESRDSDATDEEDGGRRSSSTKRRKLNPSSGNGARVTRNRGKSTKNLAEDGSETEDEGDAGDGGGVIDSDDEGCAVCGTIEPPADGSNPILLCDHCDRQLCLHCIPLERVPTGKWFCDECTKANPKIR